MTYGKVYKALELCCKYMRVLTMEVMTGLVPKGTGKNNINHLQIKIFPSEYKQTVFLDVFRVSHKTKYLIISLKIKESFQDP